VIIVPLLNTHGCTHTQSGARATHIPWLCICYVNKLVNYIILCASRNGMCYEKQVRHSNTFCTIELN
jgi:hypothetical protein